MLSKLSQNFDSISTLILGENDYMPYRILKNAFIGLVLLLIAYSASMSFSYAAAFQNGSFENNTNNWLDDVSISPSLDVDFIGSAELNDITDWTLTVPTSTIHWYKKLSNTLPTAQSGNYYVKLGNSATGHKMEQAFDTVNNHVYSVTYYVFTEDTAAASAERTMTLTVRNTNSSGTTLATHADAATTTSWVQKSFTFTATSGTSHITLAQTSGSSKVFIDNIVITDTSLAPPAFDNTNSNVYPYDISNQQLKAIPGQTMVFDIGLRNTGTSPDANSAGTRTFYFVISVPNEIAFQLNSIVYTDGKQPYATATGNPTSSGNSFSINNSTLLCCGTSGDIEYSTVGTSGSWSTSPPASDYTDGGYSYTYNVRAIRISPRGTFADGSSSATGFRVYYMGQIR